MIKPSQSSLILTRLFLGACLTNCVVASPSFEKDAQPLLAKYCYSCHGSETQDGGIEFHKIKTKEDAFRFHKLLANAAEQVHTEEMPPVDADEFPNDTEIETLQETFTYISNLVQEGKVPPNPGRTTIRRLNRNEYNYTVRDLFGITFQPAKDFPADAAGGEGFDNTADSLFLPPALLEKYLIAANSIADTIYADKNLRKNYLISKPIKGQRTPQKAAKKIIEYHTTLAYRRRPDPQDDIQPLVDLFLKSHTGNRTFEEAMRLPLIAILINPKFIYRSQHDEEGKSQWPLDQFELASRLSYFLWSSMPDRELFRVADQGKLSEPNVLRSQVLRMLADPKSIALAKHFGGQWLGYEDLIDHVHPDTQIYPKFTRSLRASMWRESVAYLNYIFQNNRSLTELIDSDYSFLNSELAKHYKLPKIKGKQLVKTTIKDRQRGGVIGMGSILTATSLPSRTSPVIRGKWVLEALLGDTPPPPPPDAGELPEGDQSSEGLTFRKQLEIHRDKPKCAGCHSKIDPIGFGLENFNAIGQWRTHEPNGQVVDSQAILPGGVEFSTPLGLKKILLTQQDKFAKNVARKLLSYSLGRPLEYYDEVVINQILVKMKESGYSSHELILSIVQSNPFQNRSTKR